ncbi:Chaperone protein dnaJ 1, mitochondrial [Dendrobium catenatum]|uniref:Chaperone protein dnaJ 1, mitochondrial n=1 Tax=Dendrobium catenatum TaxID=906689 RepID=A0A2I0WZJ0_9ASPA|nr:Chaperone protein dnaJ 1, mitochondrial [Dendrobium catenatum]
MEWQLRRDEEVRSPRRRVERARRISGGDEKEGWKEPAGFPNKPAGLLANSSISSWITGELKYFLSETSYGVDSGDTIKVPKAGNQGRRGVLPGDLHIKLQVAKNPIFKRDGADIYVDANISFTQVAAFRPFVMHPQGVPHSPSSTNSIISQSYLGNVLPTSPVPAQQLWLNHQVITLSRCSFMDLLEMAISVICKTTNSRVPFLRSMGQMNRKMMRTCELPSSSQLRIGQAKGRRVEGAKSNKKEGAEEATRAILHLLRSNEAEVRCRTATTRNKSKRERGEVIGGKGLRPAVKGYGRRSRVMAGGKEEFRAMRGRGNFGRDGWVRWPAVWGGGGDVGP